MSALLVSLAVSAAASGISIPVGRRLGILDRPVDPALKIHTTPVVPLGGAAVLTGVTLTQATLGELDWGLLAAGLLLFAIGLFDDLAGLPPWFRLVATAAAGWIFVTFGRLPEYLDAFPVLVILALLVAVNAVNLFDGLDGLVGSTGAMAALGIALLAHNGGGSPFFGLLLAGSMLGFLPFNWSPARLFLGDNGTYVVGLYLTYGIANAAATGGAAQLIPGILVGGVFLLDLSATLIRRRRARVPLFAGDRSHLYDQMRDRGASLPGVLLLANIVQLGFVGLAVVLQRVGSAAVSSAATGAVVVAILILLRSAGFLSPAPD